MARADDLCRRDGLRFTHLRRRVLELIWASHRPAPAYDLLAQLRDEKPNAQPPTVYRALDFLLQNRLAHKIQSHNAYVGCNQPQRRHIGQFLICDHCRRVAELDDGALNKMLASTAAGAGLSALRPMVEISGQCAQCRRDSSKSAASTAQARR